MNIIPGRHNRNRDHPIMEPVLTVKRSKTRCTSLYVNRIGDEGARRPAIFGKVAGLTGPLPDAYFASYVVVQFSVVVLYRLSPANYPQKARTRAMFGKKQPIYATVRASYVRYSAYIAMAAGATLNSLAINLLKILTSYRHVPAVSVHGLLCLSIL